MWPQSELELLHKNHHCASVHPVTAMNHYGTLVLITENPINHFKHFKQYFHYYYSLFSAKTLIKKVISNYLQSCNQHDLLNYSSF